MTIIRTKYPKVRSYVKSGNTYFQVDLRRKGLIGPSFKNFTKRADALARASTIGNGRG